MSRPYPLGLWSALQALSPRAGARAVLPEALYARLAAPLDTGGGSGRIVVTMQVAYDRFYAMLFHALAQAMREERPLDLRLVTIASSGAQGYGPIARCKRGVLAARLRDTGWIPAYRCGDASVGLHMVGTVPLFAALRERARVRELQSQLADRSEQPSLEIEGIEVADLIIDSFLRLRPAARFDPEDSLVTELVAAALRQIRRARDWFDRVRPRLYLTSYTSYLAHGIPARIAVASGVRVWSFGHLGRMGEQVTREHPFHTRDTSDYARRFAQIPDSEACLAQARAGLEARLSGGVDAATSYMRRSAYAQGGTTGALPAGLRGAAIVFMHDFCDSPHIYADLVFPDFWRWLEVTIETLDRAGIPCFLKPHPNQIADSERALAQFLATHPTVRCLPGSVSNLDLAQAGIACGVTVYGTVAHELAYLGVPTIACARHPHHAFGFCRTARSVDEYRAMLRDARRAPMPVEAMRREALVFYYMHNLEGSENERALRDAFVDLWRASNMPPYSDSRLIAAFDALVASPALRDFTRELVS